MFLITLVVACAAGQCQTINGQTYCPAPAPTYLSSNPYYMDQYPAPQFYPARLQPRTVTVGYPVTTTRAEVPANAPRALAPKVVQPAAKAQAKPERRPTATPGPPISDQDTGPITDAPLPIVPRKAAGLPQDGPPPRSMTPVGQLTTNVPGGNVELPSGEVATLPNQYPGKVEGMPQGDAPSRVVTKEGNRLPNYAVSGMLWKPSQNDGFQASPHPEGHALIESLSAPEAPVPEMIDDSGKLRVTLISSNPADRRQAIEDFRRGNGPLAPFKDKVLVQGASPDSWMVKPIGLADINGVSQGRPGVVIQEPGGRAIYASAKYSPEESAEALRKANPNFDPKLVPGDGDAKKILGMSESDFWSIVGILSLCSAAYFASHYSNR